MPTTRVFAAALTSSVLIFLGILSLDNDHNIMRSDFFRPRLSQLQRVVQQLEQSQHSYYIYDLPNMTRHDIREKVFHQEWTWKKKYGQRFKDYARWELRYLEALEQHPFVQRTHDIEQADFFLINIPIGALVMAGSAEDMRLALDTLYATPTFQQYSEKHVMFSFLEPLFVHRLISQFTPTGITRHDYEHLANITAVLDRDPFSWAAAKEAGLHVAGHWEDTDERPLTRHGWSLSFAGGASDRELVLRIPELQEFHNRSLEVFYHTRDTEFWNNSTIYRRRPVEFQDQFVQPSSIGYDIPKEQWREDFSNAKFCLTVRGDNPASRSLARAIRNGCVPIIASDLYQAFAPMFRSFLNFSDYAIMIDEESLLENPATAINAAIANADVESLLDGLRIVQRFMVADHPQSLLVEAFCAETLASQQPSYYDFHFSTP